MTKPTGKPRGRPRKDGLPAGSTEARRADAVKARRWSGANAPTSPVRTDPRLSLPFPLFENGDSEDPAERAIAFLETLKIPEGKMAGQVVRLAEFQKRFVRGALAEGVMVACLSIGRGNGKTALSAGLSLAALVGVLDDQPKREILFAARNRDQARTAFNFLTGYIEGLPEELQELFTVRRGSKLEVEFEGNGGGLARVIAADGKSILGGAPTLALMDERAAWERESRPQIVASVTVRFSGGSSPQIPAKCARAVTTGRLQKLGQAVKIDVHRPLQSFDAGGSARAVAGIVQALAQAKDAGLTDATVQAAFGALDWKEALAGNE